MRRRRTRTVAAALCAGLVAGLVAMPGEVRGQEAAGDWDFSGGARHDTVRGESALRLGSGRAIRRDVDFRDGTIEFDVALVPERSFVFVQFRMESDTDYEEVYFRPHKSGLPDAMQYAPVFQGASQWQLYHGRGATAAETLPHEGWVHVRIEVRGRRAEVYVGDGETPSLAVDRLAREPASGPIAFSAFRPGAPEDEFLAGIAHIEIRPATPAPGAENPSRSGDEDDLVRRWRVAAPFDAGDPPWDALPANLGDSAGWRVLETEPGGLLLLQRHFTRTPGRQSTAAHLALVSDEARTVPLDLGYSDAVTVFLNGRALFSADDGYSFDEPRRDGLIGLDQARLYLPLEAGKNEIVVLISDTFGGWGLMGRLPDRRGIRVEPSLR